MKIVMMQCDRGCTVGLRAWPTVGLWEIEVELGPSLWCSKEKREG